MRTPCRVRRVTFTNLCFFLAVFVGGNSAKAANVVCTDLSAAIRAGSEKSESVQIENAAVEEAGAQLDSARAGVMPSLALSGTATKAEGVPDGSAANVQSGLKIILSQPLYKGGREYALLRAANAQLEAGQAKAAAAMVKSARDLTVMYFNTLGAQAEVAALTDLRGLSERRYSEIKSRVAIGRSRATDGLGAEAQVSSARAQLDAAKIQLESVRRSLESATGLKVDSVCDVPVGDVAVGGVPGGAGPTADWEHVRQKVLARPDIIAERIALDVARESVNAARAGHMPSFDLSGNYYLKRATSSSANSNWDVTLSASLPLFSGGGVNAAVREAKAVEVQQSFRQQLAERSALDEARDLWERFAASQKQNEMLDESAKKSDVYYRRVAQDERLGLASSLETLQALTSAIDARRAAVKARVQLGQTRQTLQLAIGSVP